MSSPSQTVIAPALGTCVHCGSAIPRDRSQSPFCCHGCHMVYRLIHDEGLAQFYTLKGGEKLTPQILFFKKKQDFAWVDRLTLANPKYHEFSLGGLECSACVWLVKKLAEKENLSCPEVNSALGRMRVHLSENERESFRRFLTKLQQAGYGVYELGENSPQTRESHSLIVRIGILSVAVMNSMVLSFAIYLGLNASHGNLYILLSNLNVLFATMAVVVGGGYFFRKALASLRSGRFHFDLPVALGIFLAYVTSCVSFFWGDRDFIYFDTLSTFIFLMLIGRYLQTKWVEKHRASVSDTQEMSALRIKKLEHASIREVPVASLMAGERVLIPAGNVIPLSLKLESPPSVEVSLEWLSGESMPVTYRLGETIPAGAHYLSQKSLVGSVLKPFSADDLSALFVSARDDERVRSFWRSFAKHYSLLVLALMGIAFFTFASTDLERAVRTLVTLSLVTCPCGIGIAIPVTQMVAQKRLLSLGVFLRNIFVLENLAKIRRLVFDKTGTLTLSELSLQNRRELDRLSGEQTSVLFSAVSQSQHPLSQALYRELSVKQPLYRLLSVEEVPGIGLNVFDGSHRYFLGRDSVKRECVFKRENEILASFLFREHSLEDLKETLQELRTDYDLRILSGDKKDRVEEMAANADFPAEQALGELSPEDKMRWIVEHAPEQTLFLGDGINDTNALHAAAISGVSLSTHLKMAEHSDFYFSSQSLKWLPELLRIGHTMNRVIWGNMVFSVFYNLGVFALAMHGGLNPFIAALLMPAVSFLVVTVSSMAMRRTCRSGGM